MATRIVLSFPWAIVPLLSVSLGGVSCSQKRATPDDPPAAAASKEGASSKDDGEPAPLAELPEGAPKLAALSLQTMVYERADKKSRALGYIRLGRNVPRGEKPIPGPDCPDGYYQVSPKGYVCLDDKATLDLNHKIIKAIGNTPPDLSKPMPYLYGFVRRDATLWNFVPTYREMDKFEYAFQGHLKEYAKHHKYWNRIDGAGANHVPLDEKGNAKMLPKEVPPMPPPVDENNVFPPLGNGELPWWLVNTHPGFKNAIRRHIPNISSFEGPFKSPFRGKVYRHAGLAVIGSFKTGKESAFRKFTVSLDGRLIAEDKIKPHYASPFHGMPIDATMFPFAIVRRREAYIYSSPGQRSSHRAPFREVIPLSGKSTLHSNKMYWQSKEGSWFMEDHIAPFTGKFDPPKTFDWKKSKWIDVSITYQSLVMYEGEKPVYATLVSTGVDGDGDPKTTKSTVRGEFRIDYKHVTTTMDADDPENRFELRDVPWVQYFEQGFALHAAYWHDDFGRMRSHGCVNLAPVDARRLFMWTDPPLPDGWHAVKSGSSMGLGTWVRVRR